MLKKDVRNLLVNTKFRSIHLVNTVMFCECTYCMFSVLFILLVCLFVCLCFLLFATILVNKDVYWSFRELVRVRVCRPTFSILRCEYKNAVVATFLVVMVAATVPAIAATMPLVITNNMDINVSPYWCCDWLRFCFFATAITPAEYTVRSSL